MRTILRLVGLAVALLSLVLWLFGGPNLRWTKTSIDRIEKDPITGLEGHFPEDRLLFGVDFLAGCWLGAGLLAGASFLFRKR